MQLKNEAAWIPKAKAQFEVHSAPFPACGSHDIIVKNHAVAINPVDWKIQSSGGFGLNYPYILGEDVAGEIIEVGSKVKHLKTGERVIANALGLGYDNAARGGFQLYPLLNPLTVASVPDDISFEAAVVLPLSISTAASGLYLKSTLALPYRSLTSAASASPFEIPVQQEPLDTPSPTRLGYQRCIPSTSKTRKSILLWGGSSSVGSSVIQLASQSGYRVITTASPSNYDYCKGLGASLVLDYHNPDIVDILIGLLSITKCVGAYDAIGAEATVRQCGSVLHALGGGKIASVGSAPDDLPKGVKVVGIGSGGIVSDEPEIASAVWGQFLPQALKKGTFKAAPEQLVVGTGLGCVQKGLDRQKEGVSARKVVVKL